MDELDMQAWLDAHALPPDEVASAQAESDIRASKEYQGDMVDVAANLFDNPDWPFPFPVLREPDSTDAAVAAALTSAAPYAAYLFPGAREAALALDTWSAGKRGAGEELLLLALFDMGILPGPFKIPAALGTGGLGAYHIAQDIQEQGMDHYLLRALAEAGPGMAARHGVLPEEELLVAQLMEAEEEAEEQAIREAEDVGALAQIYEEATQDATTAELGKNLREKYRKMYGEEIPITLLNQTLHRQRQGEQE